jgi:uncharacterized protein involved in response to NO
MAAIVLAAPHRLLFLVGVCQLVAGLVWWAVNLLALGGHVPAVALPVPASLLHASVLIHLALPPFFFGFLLTVFPRWIGYPDAGPRIYVPVGGAYLAAALLLWIGLIGGLGGVVIAALGVAALGEAWAGGNMARWLAMERQAGRPPTWHGWSALAAVLAGLACLLVTIAGLALQDGPLLRDASRVALLLFVIPVFMTVGHRMIPFFAANVVADYVRWRPFWLLGAFWGASVVAAAAMLAGIVLVETLAYAVLAGLTGLTAWKWWPRGRGPGLLWVLILGFAWAPVGFALKAVAGLTDGLVYLAAVHALTMGFVCSLVIAMVTRVSQGHSGRPLVMPLWSWVAFAGVQAATLVRLWSALAGDPLALLVTSAVMLAVMLTPWASRATLLYLSKRADGRPG